MVITVTTRNDRLLALANSTLDRLLARANSAFDNIHIEIVHRRCQCEASRRRGVIFLSRAMKPTQGVRFVGFQPQNRTGESPEGGSIASDLTL